MSMKKWDELGDLFMCSSPATKANPPKDFFLLCIKKDKDSYYDTSLIFSKQESGDPIKIEKWKLDKLHEIMKTKPISQKTLTKMLNNPENWITEKWLLANKKYLGLFSKKEEGTLASVRLDQTNSFFPNLVDQAPDSNKDKWNSIPSSYLFLALNAKGHYQLCYKKRKGGWSYEVIPEAVFVKMPNRKNILDTLKPYLPKDLLKKVQMPEVVINTEWIEANVRKVDFSFKPLKKELTLKDFNLLSFGSHFLTSSNGEINGVGVKMHNNDWYQWLPVQIKNEKIVLLGYDVALAKVYESSYMRNFRNWPTFNIDVFKGSKAPSRDNEVNIVRKILVCENDMKLWSHSDVKKQWEANKPYSWFICYGQDHRINIGLKVSDTHAYIIYMPPCSFVETNNAWFITKKGIESLSDFITNTNCIPVCFQECFEYSWISSCIEAVICKKNDNPLAGTPLTTHQAKECAELLWYLLEDGGLFFDKQLGVVCKKENEIEFSIIKGDPLSVENIPYLNRDMIDERERPTNKDKEEKEENKKGTDLCYIHGMVLQCFKDGPANFETGIPLSYKELYQLVVQSAIAIPKTKIMPMIKELFHGKK